MTLRLRVRLGELRHTVRMDRETYIAPIVEGYIPDACHAEKLALTAELFSLFDALLQLVEADHRFDSITADMVESDSREELNPAQTP